MQAMGIPVFRDFACKRSFTPHFHKLPSPAETKRLSGNDTCPCPVLVQVWCECSKCYAAVEFGNDTWPCPVLVQVWCECSKCYAAVEFRLCTLQLSAPFGWL